MNKENTIRLRRTFAATTPQADLVCDEKRHCWRGSLQRASFQHDMGFIGLLLLLLQDTPPLERQLQRQPLLWVLKIMAQQVADMVEPVEQ